MASPSRQEVSIVGKCLRVNFWMDNPVHDVDGRFSQREVERDTHLDEDRVLRLVQHQWDSILFFVLSPFDHLGSIEVLEQ